MQKLSDLARRPDFRVGPLFVSPARRRVEGSEGHADLEPLIMQVFLLLLDARGQVVTRDQLFDQVWGGAVVGDDSLNRAVAKVRKALADVAPGVAEIETIPRTGYRLVGELVAAEVGDFALTNGAQPTRRAIVAGGLAVAGTLGLGLWALGRQRTDPVDVNGLIERGHQVLRGSVPGKELEAVTLLGRAVRLDPQNGRAWGLLALAYRDRVENGSSEVVTVAFQDAERAARRALELDPANGNALTALATLRPEFGNWQSVETKLRHALAKDRDCVAALNSLTLVLQSVGRGAESFRLNERAASLDPFDVTPQYRLAIKSWIFGRVAEADLVLERGLQTWPDHPALWNTRLMVLAYSGRQAEGLHFLDQSLRSNPALARSGALWRITLEALSSKDPESRAKGRESLKERAAISSGASMHAIMSLSALGFIDDAFEVANGYFRWRGKLAGAGKTAPNETLVNDQAWRRTMALFTPATRTMRIDPRFRELTEGIGMADYWRRTGTRPDPFFFA